MDFVFSFYQPVHFPEEVTYRLVIGKWRWFPKVKPAEIRQQRRSWVLKGMTDNLAELLFNTLIFRQVMQQLFPESHMWQLERLTAQSNQNPSAYICTNMAIWSQDFTEDNWEKP